MEELYACPVCGGALQRQDRTYRCEAGHCYDIAARGYVNLMPPKHSPDPGDNKQMVQARRSFLSQGYYAPLAEELSRMLSGCDRILDAGCGEGYYTAQFPGSCVYGVDISRNAVYAACARTKNIHWTVASVFALPLQDHVFDAAVSVFSPICAPELCRVLRPGGRVYVAYPGARHLFELKSYVYDTPYENDEALPDVGGLMTPLETRRVNYRFTVTDREQLKSLFSMTPYAYHTPRENLERLETAPEMIITADFLITCYQV